MKDEKLLGNYTYSRYFGTDGRGGKVFRDYSMRVEIVGEKYTRYRVKYLGADASKGAPGSLHWVQKANVKLDTPATPPEVRAIRLPYKGDE